MNNIVVFGVGAIGSNLVLTLLKQNPKINFIGVDCDKVEDRNIATQQFFLNHIGLPKAAAISAIVNLKARKFAYKPKVIEITSHKDIDSLVTEFQLTDNDLFIDCFDNSESRRIITDYGFKNCLHIGFSPLYTAEIIWNEQYDPPSALDPTRDDICGVAEAGAFINFVVSFSAFVVSDFLTNGIKNNFLILHKYIIRRI